MPGEPKTGRGRASRDRIVERAAELFAERGIAATSVDEILTAAGAGKGQFYHYFRGRDELAAAAVEHRCAQVLSGLTQALGHVSSLAGLERALGGFAARFERTGMPGCPIGTLATEVAGRNEDARMRTAAAFDAWERLLADALERMRQRGELRADADPSMLATGLLASIEGGMVLSSARKDMASLRTAVDAGLAGVRAAAAALREYVLTWDPERTVQNGGMRHFDLIIIGSGAGNRIIDERFAGWTTAIVEKGVGSERAFGGTCLNVGCIPSKMFVHTADVAAVPDGAARLGLNMKPADADWPGIRDRVFGRIDPIAASGERYRAEGTPGMTLLRGTARFTGERRLAVELADGGTAEIGADRIVVAAGSRPAVPPVPGLAEAGYRTSDDVMRLERLPRRMIIMGSGFIATELAHVFAALGVQITLLARSDRLLRKEDADIARRYTELAAGRFDVRLNRHALKAERDAGTGQARVHLTGPDGDEQVAAEELLVAVGRVRNSDLIDAAAGGLALTHDGRIDVDACQRSTSAPGVWALGDVSSPYELTHVANREARTVQHNLLHPDAPVSTDHRFVPHAVFTEPRVAAVGLTEQQAKDRGLRYVTAVHPYSAIAYGWAMEDTAGFAKLIADPATGRLLGAHIIGPEAPTLIQPLIQAMQFGLDARRMAREQYWIHPAMPELIENALLKLPLD